MRDEFALIARYFAPLSARSPGAYGLLDDAAVITPAPGFELVVNTVAIVAGVDYPPEGPSAAAIRRLANRLLNRAADRNTERHVTVDIEQTASRDPRRRRAGFS